MTYLEAAIKAITELGGEAPYDEIYKKVESFGTVKGVQTNPLWQNSLRAAILSHSSDSETYNGKEDLFYQIGGVKSGKWGLRRKNNAVSLLPEEVPETYPEGAKESVLVNKYERNPKNRKQCLDHFGTKCMICGFDFAEKYGEEFYGIIHVHHIIQISTFSAEREIDPIKDLIPVCPNCHAALHSKSDCYTPEELMKKLEEQKKR